MRPVLQSHEISRLVAQGRIKAAADLYGEKPMPASLGVEVWFQGEDDLSPDITRLLVFWETWCLYCAHEMPRLQRLYAGYKDRNFQIVGLTRLTWGSTERDVREYIARNKLTFPIAKSDGSLDAYFGVWAVPTAVAIQDGRTVWIGDGSRATERVLEGLLSSRTKADTGAGL